jgi:hypothetical protein
VNEVNGTLRIEFVERETPGGRTWGAKQIQVERMEDSSLLVMIVHLAPVVLDNFDFVPAVTLISTSMEEASVFVPLNSSFDFASLFPHQELGIGNSAEDTGDDRPKISLRRCQGTSFFHMVQQVNYDSAISFLMG